MFWSSFFASLPESTRLLDLATGNGAVLAIAAEHSKDFSLHGVDQADIGETGPGGSTFHPHCGIEALPFEDNSFDAVTSQYGFEYSNTTATIPEIARVATPGASLRLLVHAKDGDVHRATSARLKRLRLLLQGNKNLITSSREICELNPAFTPPARVKKLEKKFHSLCNDLLGKFTDAPLDDAALYAVNYLGDLVANRHCYDPTDTLRCIAELTDDTNAYAFRIRSMLSAAQSDKGMQRIAGHLESSGFREVHFDLLEHGNNIVGWDLSAVLTDLYGNHRHAKTGNC